MEHQTNKIQALPKDVRSLIRTGVALTSFAQAVEELVLNAIDAKATSVAVRIDLSCFKIQVVDNGQGITQHQFSLIGERYSTSKCHNAKDLEHLNYFGYRGEALASLRNAASFFEIVSRPKGSCLTYSKCFQRGESLGVTQPSTHRPSHGTTITAHDLFYNLPVRRNSLNVALEVEKIRYRLAGIALMWPKISISLRDDCSGNVILQTQKCSGILAVFSQLFTPARARGLAEVDFNAGDFRINGLVSKESYSRKDLQFVFVNKRLVLKSSVHKQINKIFRRSLVLKRKGAGSEETEKIRNYSQINYPQGSPSKQIDQYAIFVLNIECAFKEYDITFDPSKTLVEFKDWPQLIHTLQDMLYGFLRKEDLLLPNMCSPSRSDKIDDVSKVSTKTANENDLYKSRRNISFGDDVSFPQQFSTSAIDSLFSETVHRPTNLPTRKSDNDEEMYSTFSDQNSNNNHKSSAQLYEPTMSKINEQRNERRKDCLDVQENVMKTISKYPTANSYFIPTSSKAITLDPINQVQMRGNQLPHSKSKAFKPFSSKDIASHKDHIDEEEPLFVQRPGNHESEPEHPFERSDSNIQQIALSKSTGYSSSLKGLREMNPFYVHTTLKDVSKVTVHTLQNLKKCSAKHSINVDELLKTPEKAVRRKSTEADQEHSPSKQQKVGRIAAPKHYEYSNVDISHEDEMHSDSDMRHHNDHPSFSAIYEHTNSSIRTCTSFLSHDQNNVRGSSREEKVNASKTTSKKPSGHSAKLARIMKGNNKSKDSTRNTSKHMMRLKSFTYNAKDGKQSSGNKTTLPDTSISISESYSNSDNCTEEISRILASQEALHVGSDNALHSHKENENNYSSSKNRTSVEEAIVTQSMETSAHRLPFSMYTATKEAHINTPKLSLVLSVPIATDKNDEQQSPNRSDRTQNFHVESSTNSIPAISAHNLSVNCPNSSKELKETTFQQSSPLEGRAALNFQTESSNSCSVTQNTQALNDEIVLDKISVGTDKDDCSSESETSQGFDVKSDYQEPCSQTPLSKFNDKNDTERMSPSQDKIEVVEIGSQGFDVKSGYQESCSHSPLSIFNDKNDTERMSPSHGSLEVVEIGSQKSSFYSQQNEIPSPVSSPDRSNILIENRKKEKCEGLSVEVDELCAHDFHPEKRNEFYEEIFEPAFQNHEIHKSPTNTSDTNVIAKVISNKDDHLCCSQTASTMTTQGTKALKSKNICQKQSVLTLKNRDISEILSVEEISRGNGLGDSLTQSKFLIEKANNCDKNIASPLLDPKYYNETKSYICDGPDDGKFENLHMNNENMKGSSSASTSSIPCGQNDGVCDKMNSSSSDALGKQMQSVFEEINSESSSSIPCGQQSNEVISVPNKSSSSLIGQSENVTENVNAQFTVHGEHSERCPADLELRENDSNSNRKDNDSCYRVKSNEKIGGLEKQAKSADETVISQHQLESQKKRLMSLSTLGTKSSKPASDAFAVTTRENSSRNEISACTVAENGSDKTSVNKVVDGDIQDLCETMPEEKKCLFEIESMATDTYMVQTNGDECEAVSPWRRVTQPMSGTSVYVNSKSGHSISEEQWSKLDSNEQDKLLALNSNIENLQQSEVFKSGNNAENPLSLSKWRDGKTPTYDADKGGDVASVVSEWTETVFLKYKLPAVLSLNNGDKTNAKTKANTTSHVEFTKDMLQCVEVLGQVDDKFIACRIEKKQTSPKEDASSSSCEACAPLLVFFDQHAAHERVRLESLTKEVYEPQEESGLQRIKREVITPPLLLQLNQDDVRLMKAFAKEFDRIGIEFDVERGCRDKIVVNTVPLCMTESRRIKGVLKERTQELISEHIDLLKSTNGTCGKLPLAIHRVLCSQACRGAVKFGDPLSLGDCKDLLSKLSSCNLPFQCAHGRPSIAPLMNLHDLEMEFKHVVKRPRLQNITRLMKANPNNNTGIKE